MQFKVPQFLDIEDKIFGPFTFKEFVYLAGGAGICFTIYKALGLFLGSIPIILVAVFSLMLTFYRPNNKPFLNMLEAGFKYIWQSKLYIWKRRKVKRETTTTVVPEISEIRGGERLGASRLRDLAWSLDVLDLQKHDNDMKS